MSSARFLVGDVFARLAEIPDASVDLVACSPPFWKQRAYLPADHPMKPFEIGQEATPGEFVDVLLRLTAEWRRVLAPHGSIAIEIGDTMSGSGGAGGDYDKGGFREGQPKFEGSARRAGRPADLTTRRDTKSKRGGDEGYMRRYAGGHRHGDLGPDQPLSKSHCMIPEAYRLALAYGLNPLTGEPSPAGRWIVRNRVIWARPNPTPGDDGDKFRRASSDIAVATLNPRRYWDGEAVREPATGDRYARATTGRKAGVADRDEVRSAGITTRTSDGTRPLYDWWNLPSDPYSGAHYAVWNPAVARRLILPLCPQKVCTACGEPSTRIVRTVNAVGKAVGSGNWIADDQSTAAKHSGAITLSRNDPSVPEHSIRETLGWTDCGHDDWRRGHVLDPFGGSGTTASVATGLGRDCTLIDFDDRNLDLAIDRIGMFLEVGA